jgi:hypothetical protein
MRGKNEKIKSGKRNVKNRHGKDKIDKEEGKGE